MKINKIFAVAGVLLALCCGSVFAKKTNAETNKLKVVTTIFPEYDWAREVIGDNADNVEVVSHQYFDMSGLPCKKGTKGYVLDIQTLSNGEKRVRKVLF